MRMNGESVSEYLKAGLTGLCQVQGVCGKAVRDINRGRGPAPEPDALPDPGLEIKMPALCAAAAKRTSYIEPVSRAPARPCQGLPGRAAAYRGYMQLQIRPAAEVSACNRQSEMPGNGAYAPVDGLYFFRVRRGRRHQVNKAPGRFGTHRGQIAQRAANSLAADGLCGGFGREMPTLDQRVGGQNPVVGAAFLPHHCGIVAGTDHEPGRSAEFFAEKANCCCFTEFL